MRKKIAAGNWKMNTTLDEGLKLASEVVHLAKDESLSETTIIIAVLCRAVPCCAAVLCCCDVCCGV